MAPQYIALIIYALDRAFELYEKKNMTKEQIKEELVKEINIFSKIQEQIKSDIEKYRG